MFDKKLRALKDRILNAFTGKWASGINPGHITLTAFAFGIGSALFAAFDMLFTGLIFWLANRILDGLDGAVARRYGKATDRGAYLDIITDFAVYALIPAAFAFRENSAEIWQAAAVMLGMFYLNAASWMYLSALIEKRKKEPDKTCLTPVEMPEGIMEGAETIIFYSMFYILPHAAVMLFYIISLLAFISVIQRVVRSFRL